MTDERETINRRIFAWLNPDGCYHEAERAFDDVMDCVVPTCKHCKAINIDPFAEWNPDYHSWDGMRLLLEGLDVKNIFVEMLTRDCDGKSTYCTVILDTPEDDQELGTAPTLPEALCAAVLNIVEQEEKDAK